MLYRIFSLTAKKLNINTIDFIQSFLLALINLLAYQSPFIFFMNFLMFECVFSMSKTEKNRYTHQKLQIIIKNKTMYIVCVSSDHLSLS